MRLSRNREEDDPRPATSGFGRGWVLSAGVLGLVALLGVGVLIGRAIGGDDQQTAASSPPSPGTTVASPPPSAPGSGACPTAPPGRGNGGDELPTVAPRTTWEEFGGGTLMVPTTDAGPYLRAATLRRCYSHTQLGAFTAAANTGIGINASPPIAKVMLENQLTPGQYRDQYLRTPGTADPSFTMRVVGARILSYTAPRAVVQIVTDISVGSDKTRIAFTLPMLWSGGDWKLAGTEDSTPQRVGSLDGYVRWEAGQ